MLRQSSQVPVRRPLSEANLRARPSNEHQWAQLIADRYKAGQRQQQQVKTQHKLAAEVTKDIDSKLGASGGKLNALDNLDVSSISSSASDSSSPSSSLASSSLSLSTNSSTSTVLAALSSIQRASGSSRSSIQSKIAKFSIDNQAACKGTKLAPQTTKAAQSDEEDAKQPPSSGSSTTSSSSGLSSMNSSAHSQYTSGSASHGPAGGSHPVDELQIGACLRQLVDRVAGEQANNEIEYKTFSLHEAILAQTRSSTTTSGSSGEDNDDLLEISQSLKVAARSVRAAPGSLDFGSDAVSGWAELVQLVQLASRPEDESQALEIARECVANTALTGQRWLVSLGIDQRLVGWREEGEQQQLVHLGRVISCQLDGRLLVWTLSCQRGDQQTNGRQELQQQQQQQQQANDLVADQLETTLDDIALALDEPVEPAECNEANRESCELLVWMLASSEQAESFRGAHLLASAKQVDSAHAIGMPEAKLKLPNGSASEPLAPNNALHKSSPAVETSTTTVTPSSSSANDRLQRARMEKVNRQRVDSKLARVASTLSIQNLQADKEELQTGGQSDKHTMALKRAASGIDLSATSQTSSGLASYYRSVASRVLSNGQSRIKSLRDEMAKLNSRMPSSSAAAKRISLAIHSPAASTSAAKQQSQQRQQQQIRYDARDLSSSATSLHFEDNQYNRAKGGQTGQKLNSAKLDDHQRRKLHSSTTRLAGEPARTPTVKPRTSILKSKQTQPTDGGCDINNNNRLTGSNNGASGAKTDPLRRSCRIDRLQQRANEDARVTRVAAATSGAARQMETKPRSILKGSSEVARCEAAPLAGSDAFGDFERHSASTGHKQEDGRESHVYQTPSRCTSQTNSKQPDQHRRRSTYSMVGEHERSRPTSTYLPSERDENDDDSGADEESLARERAFERLRQRASCYDISRLMSRNGIQNELVKLRAGSTNSVAAKLRQRRPALLLDERSPGNKHQVAKPAATKTTQSGADGTVRAKVSVTQIYAPAQSLNRSRKQQTLEGRESTVGKPSDDETARRSEFDPRSLRKISVAVEAESSAASRRKSITSVRLEDPASERKTDELEKVGGKVKVKVMQQQPLSTSSSNEDSSTECDEEEDSVKREALAAPTSLVAKKACEAKPSSLSKSGPFSLLRQSFNQKTISSMLKFSSRASMRVKALGPASAQPAGQPVQPPAEGADDSSAVTSAAPSDKATAIALAEANLLAAKQLKQQAQRLKEQQKRVEQQHQQQHQLDQTAAILAAAQYNQQLQRHHQQHYQQQQQQFLYQQQAQQFAQVAASRAHMFDASTVHLQQQILYQRHQQQQQQLAYMANLNHSAHYVAQQMAVMAPAPLPSQPMVYMQPACVPVAGPQVPAQPSGGLFKKSMLKSSSKQSTQTMMYSSQQSAQQQLIPMAVNHHSSFNIVYAGSPSAQQQQQQQQQVGSSQQQVPVAAPATKQSSLGASMRKTVRSMLISRSSSATIPAGHVGSEKNATEKGASSKHGEQVKLKSALKTASSRELVLNSEGSDGDGSSSDSTMTNSHGGTSSVAGKSQTMPTLPKSVLKKNYSPQDSSSDSSSSSIRNNGGFAAKSDNRFNGDDTGSGSANRASKRVGGMTRKNVTFSTKLTSIQ